MKKSSKNRLMPFHQELFPKNTLFDTLARTVCRAGTLPRKELYETWEVARRVRRKLRGGRVVDLACGHGLLAHIMLILDDSSAEGLAVDQTLPKNSAILSQSIIEKWPRLKGRIRYEQNRIENIQLKSDDIIVSAHACGRLTDQVLDMAVNARARVGVLPCCHDGANCETNGLEAWMDISLAIDSVRVCRIQSQGYKVYVQQIPNSITPKNRLILARPNIS